ncbi:asparagine synthase (glutamine-hydrolyzing) [Bosea sp. (in: a-proteobacteria)]|jgi:asparagine synthase (glutamine-hydrolysing)|uniref:asparagine synthase (glutamine-hydrolyzing) n=1 Tax=Bosea sp. (in: a-proteobacteria) TaxID=1871050 RepID=UPI00226CA232|nr:asparagine synthase (glutamine-hydrolyzing) [Bosea sp. (in: a-proteobacteria)]MDP3407489.1 asparagine synthase (glutamine-hydrolyzing) [Bosea sp. (in: a-proteobacteria)]
MCGVAGYLNRNGAPADERIVAAMRDALAHRGPDGKGMHIDGPLGLGHRRLSIIDLRTVASQPMHSPDGRWTIAFNGEIYNFRELKAELDKAGWSFRTRSDTEVLLAGCVIWGVSALARRIDGMAAFALWDAQERRLHLVRDRYGVKPLYLWRTPDRLAFASEIKAFLVHPDFRVRVNQAALREYFTFQNLFRPHTLFEGVEHLPPATILTVDRNGERRETYWDYDYSKPEPVDEQEAVATLEKLMAQAVERQLVADVPVGAYLSGGMDSGTLVALAHPHVPRMQTFTAGFEMSRIEGNETLFDERRAAELMAYTYKTEHYEQVINAGDIRWSLPRVVWHLEDLRLGMSYPNYYIARLASKFVKVCLSGAGGDELFGGYPWRYYRVFRSLDRDDYLSSYYGFWQRLTTADDRKRLFGAAADDEAEMFDVFKSVYADAPGLSFDSPEDHISASLYFECRTFLSGLLLVGDKLSMASGLEERFPFLDNALVDFATRLPARHKLSDLEHMLTVDEDAVRKKLLAEDSFAGGKSCLRQAMAHVLPSEIMDRRKQGFSSPEASWYRGENAVYVRDMLLGKDLASTEYLDADFIRDTVEAHMSGKKNNRLLIWSLLSFEQWCRVFLGGDRPDSRR